MEKAWQTEIWVSEKLRELGGVQDPRPVTHPLPHRRSRQYSGRGGLSGNGSSGGRASSDVHNVFHARVGPPSSACLVRAAGGGLGRISIYSPTYLHRPTASPPSYQSAPPLLAALRAYVAAAGSSSYPPPVQRETNQEDVEELRGEGRVAMLAGGDPSAPLAAMRCRHSSWKGSWDGGESEERTEEEKTGKDRRRSRWI